MRNKSIKSLSEKERMEMIKKIYQEFSGKVLAIEKERDERLAEIIKEIDQRKIKQLIKELNNN